MKDSFKMCRLFLAVSSLVLFLSATSAFQHQTGLFPRAVQPSTTSIPRFQGQKLHSDPYSRKEYVVSQLSAGDDIDQEKLLEYLDSGRRISFQEYEKEQKLLGYLENCPIFTGLSAQERQLLLRCMEAEEVPAGKTVVKQGATGDAMYFLERGKLDCIDETNDNVLLTQYAMEGDYFGELALAFDQPRSATIRAVEDTILYRLDKTAFASTVVGSPMYDTVKQLVLKKYKGSKLRDVVAKVSPDELLELARAKLQSKKKPVSIESNLKVFCYGAAACIFSGLWSPGFDAFGWPSFFSLGTLAGVPRVEIRLVTFLMTLRALLASIDTPTSKSNEHRAKAVGWLSATSWFISESNLNGAKAVAPLNAWGLGRPLLVVSFLEATRQCLKYVLSSLGQGKTNLLSFLALGTASTGLLAFILPILGSFDGFRAEALPYLSTCSGIVPNVCLVQNLMMALLASGGKPRWFANLTAAISGYEVLRVGSHGLSVAVSNTVTPYSSYINYLLTMSRRWQAFPILFAAWMFAVVKLFRGSTQGTADEIPINTELDQTLEVELQ
jgi:CRP-like cAMP-binding protein